MAARHGGNKFNCDFCEYSTTRKETLKVHEDAIHKQLTVEILETEQLEHVDAFEPVTIKHVPPNTTHSEHFCKPHEHLDNISETNMFLKLLDILTSHMGQKLQLTDSIGNPEKL